MVLPNIVKGIIILLSCLPKEKTVSYSDSWNLFLFLVDFNTNTINLYTPHPSLPLKGGGDG
jgi:hypothetical protein